MDVDIDDATAAIEGLCACPCRRPIPADHPSAWFYSPDCQQGWHEARCTDPQQVYRGMDADMSVDADEAELRAIRRQMRRRTAQLNAAYPPPANDRVRVCGEPEDGEDPYDVAVRMTCPSCRMRITPTVWQEQGGGRYRECPRCLRRIAGPVFIPVIDYYDDRVELKLTYNGMRVMRTIMFGYDPDGAVRSTSVAYEAEHRWRSMRSLVTAAARRHGRADPCVPMVARQ